MRHGADCIDSPALPVRGADEEDEEVEEEDDEGGAG